MMSSYESLDYEVVRNDVYIAHQQQVSTLVLNYIVRGTSLRASYR